MSGKHGKATPGGAPARDGGFSDGAGGRSASLSGPQCARVEALRLAMDLRRAQVGAGQVIAEAKVFASYILDGERRSPAGDATEDEAAEAAK